MEHLTEIVFVNYYSEKHLHRCVQSLEDVPNISITVVDNSDSYHAEFVGTKVIVGHGNVGFGGACNIAVNKSTASRFLFLNPDTVFTSADIERLLAIGDEFPDCIVGPILKDDAGCFSWISFRGSMLTPYIRKKAMLVKNSQPILTSFVSGAAMLVGAEVFEKVGGFDEDIFLYCEDFDLCIRARNNGVNCLVLPEVALFHSGGDSSEESLGKLKRLYISYRGHLVCLRKYYGPFTARLSAFYLAAGFSMVEANILSSSNTISEDRAQ